MKKFQADHKLPTTGYYGELTHAAMKKDAGQAGRAHRADQARAQAGRVQEAAGHQRALAQLQ